MIIKKIKYIYLFILTIKVLLFSLICSYLMQVYLNILHENYPLDKMNLNSFYEILFDNYLQIIYIAAILFFIILICMVKSFQSFIYKYRYLIAIFIFFILVYFEIHGSSIGYYNNFINSPNMNNINLLGISRPIRSDEFGVSTPFAFSQFYNEGYKFPYFSDTIRGTYTDVFILYGQPVLDIAVIFRFFHLGYLFLGLSRGLSFFWMGRLIGLFLTTFEMMMIITNKNKILSTSGALLVAFAPVIQWWFAINGLVETIIFGQLAIILLYKYMNTENYLKRMLSCIFIAICLGSFLFAIYPPWQIPMAYFMLILAIWVFITNRKNSSYGILDLLIITISASIFVIGIIYVFLKSWDTIQIVKNTVYPGKRFIEGGNNFTRFFNYAANIFFPIKDITISNNCEESVFFDFFPINFIITLIVLFRNRKKDFLLISLFILNSIFILFCMVKLPYFFVKYSLLSNCEPGRLFVIIGLINLFMLIRALSIMKKSINKIISILLSLALSILIILYLNNIFWDYLNIYQCLIIILLIVFCFYSILQFKSNIFYSKALLVGCLIISFMSGSLVNPIARGISNIYDNPLANAIYKTNKEVGGIWIVENIGFPMINFPIMLGAKTINSTNIYPDLNRWKQIDISNKYTDVYNRYAHINIYLRNEVNDKFNLLSPDYFEIDLNVNSLKILNVKCILSSRELSDFNNENINFEKKYDRDGYKIFIVNYL